MLFLLMTSRSKSETNLHEMGLLQLPPLPVAATALRAASEMALAAVLVVPSMDGVFHHKGEPGVNQG